MMSRSTVCSQQNDRKENQDKVLAPTLLYKKEGRKIPEGQSHPYIYIN